MYPLLPEDIQVIKDHLGKKLDKLNNRRILVTGACGFLGYNFVQFLTTANKEENNFKCEIVCLDHFLRGAPEWFIELQNQKEIIAVEASIIDIDISSLGNFDYIIHAASIASPKFYRKYPIETMDANVIGLRNVLEYSKKNNDCLSILNFSSSEIYGDPSPDQIPTKEDYRGLVSCTGPRSCYDESKRYGETLCVNFYEQHKVPVKIVRPFNNYGPGLKLDDARVIPDFCSNILKKEDIVLLSDGAPTRTFCYVADAIGGYLLTLLSDHHAVPLNIGNPDPEISMLDLAKELVNSANDLYGNEFTPKVKYQKSDESNYLSDNPNRRCPDITRAQELLGYQPKVDLTEGLKRTLKWYRQYYKL